MCGIAGIYCPSGLQKGGIQSDVSRMINSIAHRGPDGFGIWTNHSESVCLGHRRLAILDLSPSGAQPMQAPQSKEVIVFNGEIYNYLELRSELSKAGETFLGGADTEVLLAAIRHWGLAEALERSVGMFAVALWDPAKRKLFLARDRAGKKPLYYYSDGNRFCFASEIKALVALGNIDLVIDEESIYHYLSLAYVPSPLTIYKKIHEVYPGKYVSVNESLIMDYQRYWRYPADLNKVSISFEDAVEETNTLLTDAVKIRLRSDVPVGTFLSGGIDSGLITAIAARISPKPLSTFTVGFDGSPVDERSLARLVAERYSTDHHEVSLSLNIDRILSAVVNAYDEPFGDPSALPTFAVAKFASSSLKVILNGEGSDELFGGYRRHNAMKYLSVVPEIGSTSGRAFLQTAHSMLPSPAESRTPYAFLHRFLRGVFEDPQMRYISWGSDGFTESEKAQLYGIRKPDFPETTHYLAQQFAWLSSMEKLRHFMAMDFVSMMSDCLLVKMDIATMAHGIEARCPFLDHRLVDWAAGLRTETLMPGRWTKPLLRELAKRYLPESIVRAPKRGFEIPLVKWTEQHFIHIVRDLCNDSNGIIRSMFDRKTVDSIVKRQPGLDNERWAKRIWILMMLGLWDKRR